MTKKSTFNIIYEPGDKMEKETNELVFIILNSDIESLDGKLIKCSCNNSHIKSLIKIRNMLEFQGISLGYFDTKNVEEAAFDLIKHGHIVFLNIDNYLGFLKMPEKPSKKQLLTLKSLESELKDFILYEQTLIPPKNETLSSKEYVKNYKVNKNTVK